MRGRVGKQPIAGSLGFMEFIFFRKTSAAFLKYTASNISKLGKTKNSHPKRGKKKT